MVFIKPLFQGQIFSVHKKQHFFSTQWQLGAVASAKSHLLCQLYVILCANFHIKSNTVIIAPSNLQEC